MRTLTRLNLSGFAPGVLAAIFATLASAQQPQYIVRDLGTLGGSASAAWSINADGVVAGQATLPDTEDIHAFRWDGAMTDLGVAADRIHSIGFAINDAGYVAGVSFNLGQLDNQGTLWNPALDAPAAFLARDINNGGLAVGVTTTETALGYLNEAVRWDGATLTILGSLGGEDSAAFAVNDTGWIVGSAALAADGPPHPFLWRDGLLSDLGTLGGAFGQALDINAANQVVGVAETAAGLKHAFLYELDLNGLVLQRTDLGDLGGDFSAALALNDVAHVVGTSNGHAFLWDGTLRDLNDMIGAGSGWVLSNATDINNAGQIVGYGRHVGQPRAFRLDPFTCTGDLDGDGDVGLSDLSTLLSNYGTASGMSYGDGDLDGDGDVDLSDLSTLLAVFGTACA